MDARPRCRPRRALCRGAPARRHARERLRRGATRPLPRCGRLCLLHRYARGRRGGAVGRQLLGAGGRVAARDHRCRPRTTSSWPGPATCRRPSPRRWPRHSARGRSAASRSAPGGRDTTRLAASDPDLWAEIFLANAGPVTEALAQAGRRAATASRPDRGARRGRPHGPSWRRVPRSGRASIDEGARQRARSGRQEHHPSRPALRGARAGTEPHRRRVDVARCPVERAGAAPARCGDLRPPRGQRHRDRGPRPPSTSRRTCSTAATPARRPDLLLGHAGRTPFRGHADGRQLASPPPDAAGHGAAVTRWARASPT